MKQDLDKWYTSAQAAKRLSENSGREIQPAYVRKLAATGIVETLPLSPRAVLYKKSTIDAYIVEPRGAKAGRAMHERAKKESVA